jgi:hypothetical protein
MRTPSAAAFGAPRGRFDADAVFLAPLARVRGGLADVDFGIEDLRCSDDANATNEAIVGARA